MVVDACPARRTNSPVAAVPPPTTENVHVTVKVRGPGSPFDHAAPGEANRGS
jgi:hypothetical protein